MVSNWVKADMRKFAVFILSHGRPHLRETYDALRSCGYTGRIIVVCDNEDSTIDEYYQEFGKENVYVFDKLAMAKRVDSANNFGKRNTAVFARHACYDIAKELGVEYFQQMDDDYFYFGHKNNGNDKKTSCYNLIARWFVEFLLNNADNVKTIAFSQGGDHIGGFKEWMMTKRKAMNSFFCLTSRPINFIGLFNDDVNSYTLGGMRGELFFTYMPFYLTQIPTQQGNGGATDIYLEYGTYVKSFTTVMLAPSCVEVVPMWGVKNPRIHHRINYSQCMPKIIREKYKKI